MTTRQPLWLDLVCGFAIALALVLSAYLVRGQAPKRGFYDKFGTLCADQTKACV